MPRLALVTGGTRGIGAGIANALKDAGYRVVANYYSADDVARDFEAETGIPGHEGDGVKPAPPAAMPRRGLARKPMLPPRHTRLTSFA